VSASIPKPARRSAKPRKRIKSRKPLGWKRRAAKAAGTVDDDMLQAILVWYGWRCAYCERVMATTWDHVVPIARGGKHEASNIVPACLRCNMTKGTQTWEPRRMHPYA
jgi:5-methylcytosine-specific restriction endonuclease McrA